MMNRFKISMVISGIIQCIFFVIMGTLYGQDKTVLSVRDILSIRQITDLDISPDGRSIAFVIKESSDPDKPESPRNSDIWILSSEDSNSLRRFAFSPKSERQPRWSPDGGRLAFLSDRGDYEGNKVKGEQIYILSSAGGEAERVTAVEGMIGKFLWSPDGESILFMKNDFPVNEKTGKKENKSDTPKVDIRLIPTRLWKIDLKSGLVSPITKPDIHILDFCLSPNGKEMACIISRTNRSEDEMLYQKLVIIDPVSGEILRTLSDMANSRVEWSPDGKSIALREFTPQRIASRLAIIPCENNGQKKTYLLDDYQGSILWAFQWAADSKSIYAELGEGSKIKIVDIDITANSFTPIADDCSLMPSLGVSKDGKSMVYLGGPSDSPPNLYISRVGEKPRQLTDINPHIRLRKVGKEHEISWKNLIDGKRIYGILITPPDYDPNRQYPTIVNVHGGPEFIWGMEWHGNWLFWGQLLASNGYVVFLPNPRGSDGQGWRFVEANIRDWGGMDYQDVMSGVDMLIKDKIADPTRLGIGGYSYGGYLTAWAITKTNRFKASIVGGGMTNLISFFGTTDVTPGFPANYFKALPYNDFNIYHKCSPLTFIKNVNTPCLILHGDKDSRVPVGQAWEFYNGLMSLGKTVDMVIYPREDHPIRETMHQKDMMNRVLEWFDRYLK